MPGSKSVQFGGTAVLLYGAPNTIAAEVAAQETECFDCEGKRWQSVLS